MIVVLINIVILIDFLINDINWNNFLVYVVLYLVLLFLCSFLSFQKFYQPIM